MYNLIRPFLFKQDPEEIHKKALKIGKYLGNSKAKDLISQLYSFDDKKLHSSLCGIDFINPVGLAAGFDKEGELLDIISCIGFGFIEIGSISAMPKGTAPSPSILRIPAEEAIINKLGLNNEGAVAVYEKMKDKTFKIPLGINIVKTNYNNIYGDKAIEDLCNSFEKLYSLCSYITLNISCPNTEGEKSYENKRNLEELLPALMVIKNKFQYQKPVLMKMSPDLFYSAFEDILQVSEDNGINGYVIINTSSDSNYLKNTRPNLIAKGKFGISGKPIKQRSTELIAHAYKHLNNPSIIGVGGIFSGEDAYEKIKAGASVVQICTGLVYEGPGLPKKINKGLLRLLERDGFASVKDAIGIDAYK
ncbi:MAG: quinone-dependent dihydroorotate dehydrogenase [Nanoarchaeota archaeon]|nr:quinone-dependent dihydroorotate dehydrogenase [Nanoarchaeota archaeon]